MVTGSNAKMLSKEIASTLGGSFAVREVFPFSWREYLSYHGVIPGQNWEFEPDTRLLQKILLGDIVTRHKISTPTVKDYLEYLEECYLVYSIPNYASPDSEQETLRKRYFMDNGLLNLYLYKGETKLLENLVALQLRRQWWNPGEPKLFYYKHGGVDLDFYVPEAKMAIQASYNLTEQDTREREIHALVDFNKAFPLERAVIVTYDQDENIDINGLTIEMNQDLRTFASNKKCDLFALYP